MREVSLEVENFKDEFFEEITVYCREFDGQSMSIYRCSKNISTSEYHVQQKDDLRRKDLNSSENLESNSKYYFYDNFVNSQDSSESKIAYATLIEAINGFDSSFEGK